MASKNAAAMLSGKDGDYDNNVAASEFFSTLLAASTYAQVLHRQTVGEGSDARHRALGDLYDGLIELSDDVVEQYQGCFEATRYKVCDETHIQNSIDEICSLLSRMKFRLRFLR